MAAFVFVSFLQGEDIDSPHTHTHFSMAETCLVSIFPLVRSSGVIRPSNSSPSLAILTRMSRTSSPMYIPLAIFSKLIRKRTSAPTVVKL